MRFVLTCGGTAGHVNPALAVAGRLRELVPNSEFLFIGAEGKMEMELVPREGYEIRPLKITNISRERSLAGLSHNLATVKNVIVSEREAKTLLQAYKPDAVIGTGGYVCYPVLKAAAGLGIPTLVHESNAVPGLTTKLLAGHVDRILIGLDNGRNEYRFQDRVRFTGTPVRGSFGMLPQEEAKRKLGLSPDEKLVVSVWGSLGSEHMNRVLLHALPLMFAQHSFHMIHSVGSRDYGRILAAIETQGIQPSDCGVDVREYIYDMPLVMTAADLVLCRAGASTLAELTYLGKPCLIVPSPNVTDNHQEKNARVLEKAGGAIVCLEGEFDAASLLKMIHSLLSDSEKLGRMSSAMRALSVSDSTDRICREILYLCNT